jgi:hypothetical protein
MAILSEPHCAELPERAPFHLSASKTHCQAVLGQSRRLTRCDDLAPRPDFGHGAMVDVVAGQEVLQSRGTQDGREDLCGAVAPFGRQPNGIALADSARRAPPEETQERSDATLAVVRPTGASGNLELATVRRANFGTLASRKSCSRVPI